MTQRCCSFDSAANFFWKPLEQSHKCEVKALALAVSIFAGLASLGSIHLVCGLYLCLSKYNKASVLNLTTTGACISYLCQTTQNPAVQLTDSVFKNSAQAFVILVSDDGKAQHVYNKILVKPASTPQYQNDISKMIKPLFDQAEIPFTNNLESVHTKKLAVNYAIIFKKNNQFFIKSTGEKMDYSFISTFYSALGPLELSKINSALEVVNKCINPLSTSELDQIDNM